MSDLTCRNERNPIPLRSKITFGVGVLLFMVYIQSVMPKIIGWCMTCRQAKSPAKNCDRPRTKRTAYILNFDEKLYSHTERICRAIPEHHHNIDQNAQYYLIRRNRHRYFYWVGTGMVTWTKVQKFTLSSHPPWDSLAAKPCSVARHKLFLIFFLIHPFDKFAWVPLNRADIWRLSKSDILTPSARINETKWVTLRSIWE